MSLRLSQLLERRAGDRRRAERRNGAPRFSLQIDQEPQAEGELRVRDRRVQNRREAPEPEVWAGLNAPQLATLATFAATSLFLFWFAAQRFSVAGDEGALLDGARRLLSGQALYRDFFTPMGPGSYWLEAVALKIFGLTLAASRITTILDVSALAACICWLVSSRVNEWYGAWVAAVFVFLTSADPVVLLPNSSWDSAALAMLALTIVASGGRPALVFLAGALASFAVWTTPGFGLLILAVEVILWLRNRGRFWAFLYGACAISIACVTVLALHGSLGSMLQQIKTGIPFDGSNYTSYGSRVGGFAGLFGTGALRLTFGAILVLGVILPALLPVAVALLFWTNRKTLSIQLLFLGAIAILAASFPRFDVQHLVYSSAVFYAVGAIFLARLQWRPAQEGTLRAASLLSLILCAYGAWSHWKLDKVATPVGTVRASSQDAAFLSRLQEVVPPRSRTFVFPDLPIAYFITLGDNPTRYSYLQPGRVSVNDESAALDELLENPPQRVIYSDIPEWQVVKLWPGGDALRLRLSQIEAYLAANYQPITTISYSGGNVQILEPRTVPRIQATEQGRIGIGPRY